MSVKLISPFLTVKECGDYLKLSPGFVRKSAKSGLIPGRKHLGEWRFRIDEIEAWSQTKTNQPLPAIAQTKFQAVRDRIRSLTTESTTPCLSHERKGTG